MAGPIDTPIVGGPLDGEFAEIGEEGATLTVNGYSYVRVNAGAGFAYVPQADEDLRLAYLNSEIDDPALTTLAAELERRHVDV